PTKRSGHSGEWPLVRSQGEGVRTVKSRRPTLGADKNSVSRGLRPQGAFQGGCADPVFSCPAGGVVLRTEVVMSIAQTTLNSSGERVRVFEEAPELLGQL